MADLYNLTALQAAKTIPDLIRVANNPVIAGGTNEFYLVSGLLLTVFIVLVMAFRKYDWANSILASSVICMILSLFLVSAHLLNLIWPLFFGIMFAFSLFLRKVMP